jgi:glycosyltransferase involved in cell wall biosynthesis
VYSLLNDPGALASSMRPLLKSKKLREDLGKEVRKRAIQHLSWDVIAEKKLFRYINPLSTPEPLVSLGFFFGN